MGTYLFRWPYPANDVYVTGTFDDWGKTVKLDKVDGGFEKKVELPSADEKVRFKFVVDDDWIVDDHFPKEDDGNYNINNILLPSEIEPLPNPLQRKRTSSSAHRVVATSRSPPGSNTENALTRAPRVSAGGEGAPLLTKEQSEANLARWIPHVTPSPDRPVIRSIAESSETQPALHSTPEKSLANAQNEPLGTDHKVLATSTAPPGSSTASASTEAPTVSAGGQGAPLLSKEQSEANLSRSVPHVTPAADRPVTRSVAQTDGPASSKPVTEQTESAQPENDVPGAFPETPSNEKDGFGVAPIPATGHDNTQSSVTTSKEDFEKAGGEGTAGGEVSVAPIPADGHKDIQSSVTTSKEDFEKAGGEGTAGGVVSALPIPAEGHKDLDTSATTSKEDYDKVGGVDTGNQEVSVNPLPATGHDNIQSSVTTSKEDYMKAGAFGTAGAVAGLGAGAALASAFSKPKETDKNIIPESSLPMNPELLDTKDSGPFISSAGPGTTTADLASQVPLEPRREAQVIDTPEAPEVSKAASGAPFISSSGPGTTTGDLASQVPLEPKRDAQVVDSTEAPDVSKEAAGVPFIASSGPGTTTADLASKVPLEPKREAEVVDAPPSGSATTFFNSSGPGTTTADLASQVPLEQKRQGQVFDGNDLAAAVPGTASETTEAGASPTAVAEKAAVEKELLQKVPTSEATGVPSSAAAAQTSYYGLATAVPEPVEESIAKAHASPEAATESSVVAEKSAVERELQQKVPVAESAGEPAPTISAATASTAPDSTSPTAASTAAAITDGKTANEAVPDTDTSTATRGPSAGEIAGGAVVGGAAAAGAAALVSRHKDRDAEPPRVDDSQKPAITTEAAPDTQYHGTSPTAAAQVSDGTGPETPGTEHAPRIAPPVEKTDADNTDYAPPHAAGVRPGVSPAAAAALSDGTEDPTLTEDSVGTSKPAGIGAASPHPGVAPIAAAAISDGTEDPTVADEPSAPKIKAPVETSEATATEYAPVRSEAPAPGVSPAAAAALSDGTEDPTLSEDKTSKSAGGMIYDKVTTDSGKAGEAQTPVKGKSSTTATDSSPTARTGDAAAAAQKATSSTTPETPQKKTTSSGVVGGTPASASSTPAKSTTGSEVDKKKKKRHRLSQIIKKIFD